MSIGRRSCSRSSRCLSRCRSRASGQELSTEAKDKAAAEARAKRNAQTFELNASTIVFYDRSGKRIGGTLGERAMYQGTVISPDGSRVAVVKADLPNESADVYVLDIASGSSTRLTTSARTEFTLSPIWSPDSSKIAYVSMRKGQEGIYVRPANGQGAEELVYRNPGAFLNLSDWSSDGKTLTFAFSDMKGGTLYTLPLEGGPDRKAIEIFKTEMQVFGPHFSPDGRFLAYTVVDKANRGEIFVRPADPAASGGPWQVSEGSVGMPFWRRDGKELYYLGRDRSVMVADVSTAPSFSFTNRRVLFKPQGAVPEIVRNVSADGERFLVVPPPRGPQLQQLTIFDRTGKVLEKIGEPGLYSQPAFSPDGTRLLVMKNDVQSAQADYWTIELASGKSTRLTNDTFGKTNALWSLDGTYIYYSSIRNGDFPVYRRRSDGTGGEEFVFQYTPGAIPGTLRHFSRRQVPALRRRRIPHHRAVGRRSQIPERDRDAARRVLQRDRQDLPGRQLHRLPIGRGAARARRDVCPPLQVVFRGDRRREMAVIEGWRPRHAALAGGRQGSVLARAESRVERHARDVRRGHHVAGIQRRHAKAAVQAARAAWRQPREHQPRWAAICVCCQCIGSCANHGAALTLVGAGSRRILAAGNGHVTRPLLHLSCGAGRPYSTICMGE